MQRARVIGDLLWLMKTGDVDMVLKGGCKEVGLKENHKGGCREVGGEGLLQDGCRKVEVKVIH